MSTETQIHANRLNSQKSTGPKTPEGKNKVSQNAVTHGLTSHRPVLDIEDTAEFRTFVNEFLDQLDPTNPLEFFFAKRSSCQAWRILRAQSYETLVLENLIKCASQKDKTKPIGDTKADPGVSPNDFRPPKTKITDYIEVDPGIFGKDDDPKSVLGQALMDDFRYHWTLDKIARYEIRLENSMIRCLDKFKKIRESKMMNFSSLRQYYREFQPRTQDFQDAPAPEQNKPNPTPNIAAVGADPHVCPNNVGEASVLHSKSSTPQESSSPNVGQASPLGSESALTPQESSSNVTQSPSLDNEIDKTKPILETSAQPDDSIYSKIENDPNALPMDSFKHWKILYCAPRGETIDIDDGLDIPEIPHRPNIPGDGEYVYCENWQHRILDMVEYPWNKRSKLTKPELTEMVDQIIRGFPDPRQFLWDFGLIKLTEQAIAKRQQLALAS